jgi:hypothetical protein
MKYFRLFSLWLMAAMAMFSLVQTVLFCHESGLEIYRGNASANWPTTIGIVESADVEWLPAKRGKYPQVKVRYRYSVGSTAYAGDIVRFGMRRQDEEQMRTLRRDYPAGKEVIVRYQGSDPGVATLTRGVEPYGYVRALVLIPMFMFMTMFFSVLFAAIYQSSLEKFRGRGGAAPWPDRSPPPPVKQNIWVAPDKR